MNDGASSPVFEPNLRNVQGVALLCGVRDALYRILLRRALVVWNLHTDALWSHLQRKKMRELMAYDARKPRVRCIRGAWRRLSLTALFWRIHPWGRFWMRSMRSLGDQPLNRHGWPHPLWWQFCVGQFCALPSHK